MQVLDVRSLARPPDRTTLAELADFSRYAHWVWPALPPPLTMEWSDSLVLALDGEVPLIVGPAAQDPLRAPGGATVVPRWAKRRLKRIAESGVPIQRVAVGHELDPDGPVRHLMPRLQSGPRPCTEEEARALVGQVSANPRVARWVQLLDVAFYGASRAARVPAPACTIPEQIIFGIVAPTPPGHGDLCLWYRLAESRW